MMKIVTLYRVPSSRYLPMWTAFLDHRIYIRPPDLDSTQLVLEDLKVHTFTDEMLPARLREPNDTVVTFHNRPGES